MGTEHKIGELTFDVEPLTCPKCRYDWSGILAAVHELYLDMVATSKMQGEPQLERYTDIYRRGRWCSKCGNIYVGEYKFIKLGNFIHLEQLRTWKPKEYQDLRRVK